MSSSLSTRIKKLRKNFNKIFKSFKNKVRGNSAVPQGYDAAKSLTECNCAYHISLREQMQKGELNALWTRPRNAMPRGDNDVMKSDDIVEDQTYAVVVHRGFANTS